MPETRDELRAVEMETEGRTWSVKKLLMVVTALAGAFLAGYVPEHLKVQDLEEQCRETRERLESRIADGEATCRVSQIHSRLGMLVVETEHQNFASALSLSTALFDAIAEAIPATTDPSSREALRKLSKQRDSVTSVLTLASPEAVIKLKQLYAELGKTGLAG